MKAQTPFVSTFVTENLCEMGSSISTLQRCQGHGAGLGLNVRMGVGLWRGRAGPGTCPG